MADNAVMITFDARVTDLLQSMDKVVQKIDKNADKFRELGEQSKKAGESMGKAFQNSAADMGRFLLATAGVSNGMSTLVDMARQVREETSQAAAKMDDLNRKFMIQSGLRGVESEKAQARIKELALKNAVSNENAGSAAVALASGGFSAEDASGAALDVFLQAQQASLKAGEDPTALAQASGQFLAAMNMPKDAANLKRVLVSAQQLFKTTDFQISDLTNLAGKSQGLAGVATPEEVLGTFNVMRDKTSADVASTSLKIFGERLMTAKGDRQSVAALARMGLKPGDVDLQGENIPAVLDRLAGGLTKIKPEDQPVIMEQLFGREALSPITGLIRDRGKIAGNIAAMSNVAGFEDDVAVATSGKIAEEQRLKNEKENRRAAKDTGFGKRIEASVAEAEKRGASPVEAEYRGALAKGVSLLTGFIPDSFMTPEKKDELAQRAAFANVGKEGGALRSAVPLLGAWDMATSGDFTGSVDKRREGLRESGAKQPVIVNVKVEAPKGARAIPAAKGLGAAVRGAP